MELTNTPSTVVYAYNSSTKESDARILGIKNSAYFGSRLSLQDFHVNLRIYRDIELR